MTDFLKSRLYIHLHSKSFKIFFAFSVVWCIACLLTVLGVEPDKEPISSAYGLWCFMEFYLSAIPVAVAYWYGDLIPNRFEDNFPFKFDHKLSFSAVLFTMLMNLFCVVIFLILGIILFLLPSKVVVYHNDPLTIFKISLVFIAASFVRCLLVIILIELTKSRIWGTIFAYLCIIGVSFELLLSIEAAILIAAGVKSSSFPISSSSIYQNFSALMPGFRNREQWVVRDLHADVSGILLKMVLYFAIAAILALILIRRKDKK